MMRRPGLALIIAVFLCVVIAALGYFLLVGPKKGKISNKQKEVEAKQAEIETQKSTYRQLLDIKNRSAEYEARLADLQAKIPAQPELPSLIRSIQAASDPATGAGLPWLSFSPGDVSAGSEGYSTYTFTMTAAGFYDEVVDLIYRMERFKRAVVIESVGLAPTTSILSTIYSKNLGLVQATISAKTFSFYTPAGTKAATTTTPSSATQAPSSATQSGTTSTK
jgi:Tfp pilus assembly protein PilO